jgi:hypothetical protein
LSDWLLNDLNLLLDFLLWLVDNLSFDSLIFGSFNHSFLSNVFSVFSFNWNVFVLNSFNGDLHNNDSFLWNLLNNFFLNCLWDVLSDVFNCVVVGDNFITWNVFIFSNCLFKWDVFNSAFTLNWCLLNYGLNWSLHDLNWSLHDLDWSLSHDWSLLDILYGCLLNIRNGLLYN